VSTLRIAAEDYLRMRRALGYKLTSQAPLLFSFVAYLERAQAATVTIELAVGWASDPAGADPVWWAKRLSIARQFARYLYTIDPACEVPPARLLPYRARRAIPYPYTAEQIAALMRATDTFALPLQAITYRTLIGLLAVSGMRVGETIALERDDVDDRDGLVRVINSKFGKSREVPLHPSAMRALAAYSQQRDQLCPRPACEAFFVSTAGTRLHAANIRRTFTRLVGIVGLTARSPRCRPRLHDLRHRFAINTLLDLHRAAVDVQARLPWLATYMGHSEVAHTFWYLTATPELLGLVAERLEPAPEEIA
jgi:integrase